MGYDSTKDKVLKTWRVPITDTETAIVNLCAYDGGEPKLQIGTTEIKKGNGEVVHARIKRWSWSELLKLQDAITEAIEIMDSLAAGKKKSTADRK